MARIVGIACQHRLVAHRSIPLPTMPANQLPQPPPHHLVGSLIQILLSILASCALSGEMAVTLNPANRSMAGSRSHPRATDSRSATRRLLHRHWWSSQYSTPKSSQRPVVSAPVRAAAAAQSRATACEDLRHASQRIRASTAQHPINTVFRLIVPVCGPTARQWHPIHAPRRTARCTGPALRPLRGPRRAPGRLRCAR